MQKDNILIVIMCLFLLINLISCNQNDKRSTITENTLPTSNPSFVISDANVYIKFLPAPGNTAHINFNYKGASTGLKYIYHKLENRSYYSFGTLQNFDSGNENSESGTIHDYPITSTKGNHVFSFYLEDKAGNFSNILEVPFTVP